MPRQLTFFDGVCIIVGIIIGSGIFSSPGLALQRAGSPASTLFTWTTASILVGLTCQCYFELGCMMPTAGGDYDYLHHTYGNRVAFSFAWFNFFISKPGSQAIIATIFGHYFETVITGQSSSISSQDQNTTLSKLISILLIIIITLINCIGIRESANFQNLMTCTKLGLVALLLLTTIIYSSYYPSMAEENLSVSNSFTGSKGIFSFGSALIACLWSFDGWADIIFLLEDLQNPYKQFPRIVLASLTIVTIAYMLMNIAYFSVLSVDEIKSSPAIAVQLGTIVSSNMPSLAFIPTFFALGVALSAGGSCHGSIMAGGKALFAVARDGRAPSILARVNQRQAPYMALLCQGFWGVVLLLLPSSSFSSLLDYFGPASWFFYAMTSSCVITLRLREPTRLRPYTLPLYPLPVILVMIIASVIIISSFATEILYTSLAFSFIALSFPVHWFLEKYRFLSDNQIDISNRIEPYEEDDRYGDGEGSTPRINLSSRSYRQVEGQEIGDNNDGDLSGLITSRSHYSDLPEKDSTPRDPLSENDRFEREIYASDMPHSRDDVYDQSKYCYDSNAYDVRNPLSSRAKINTRLQPSSTAVHKSGVVGIPSITHSLMRPDGYAHVTTVDTAETVIEASNQLSSEVPLYADVDLNDNDNGDGLEYDT